MKISPILFLLFLNTVAKGQVDLYDCFILDDHKIKSMTNIMTWGDTCPSKSRVMEFWEVDTLGRVVLYKNTPLFDYLDFPTLISDCDTVNSRRIDYYTDATKSVDYSSFCFSSTFKYPSVDIDSLSVTYVINTYRQKQIKEIFHYQKYWGLRFKTSFEYKNDLLRKVIVMDVTKNIRVMKCEYIYTYW